MHKFFLSLLLWFPVHTMLAQSDNLTSAEHKGRVKQVTETQYYDASHRHPFMRTVDRYDTHGRLTEEQHDDYALGLRFRKVVSYDTTIGGRVTKLTELNDSGRLIRSVDYMYDSLGRLTETTEHRTIGDRQEVHKAVFFYDSAGHKVTEKLYTNEMPDYYTTCSYDSKGRISATKSVDVSGKVVMFHDYNYLPGGTQWVHCEKQVGDERTHLFRIVDSAGVLLEKTTCVSDYSRQVTESYSDFDHNGNWLQESIKGGAAGDYFITRTIEYYNDDRIPARHRHKRP